MLKLADTDFVLEIHKSDYAKKKRKEKKLEMRTAGVVKVIDEVDRAVTTTEMELTRTDVTADATNDEPDSVTDVPEESTK